MVEATGVILAGGGSRRMGFDKAMIEVAGLPMIERAKRVLGGVFNETFVVAGRLVEYQWLGVRTYADLIKGKGSLGGIHTALFHAETPYVFVVACDMPSLDSEVIRAILETPMKGYDAAAPFIGGRLHPLHALYSKRCIDAVEAMLREGKLRATELLMQVRTKRLGEDFFNGLPVEASLMNINTKEELESFKKTLQGQ